MSYLKRSDSAHLNREQLEELNAAFQGVDLDGNGYISVAELQEALAVVGLKIPGHEVRELIRKHDTSVRDGRLDMNEFRQLYAELKEDRDIGMKLPSLIKKATGVKNLGGLSETSADGTTHSVRNEEQVAFSNWINRNFADHPDCKKYLPLNPETNDLYDKCNDGVLYCYLVNLSQPGTIDERAINKASKLSIYQIHENLTLRSTPRRLLDATLSTLAPRTCMLANRISFSDCFGKLFGSVFYQTSTFTSILVLLPFLRKARPSRT
jgi:hypothetical protein